MEEQNSIVLQKKMILAVFTIIFTFMSVSNVIFNELKKVELYTVACNNEVKNIENDIELIEQIAYAAVTKIEKTVKDEENSVDKNLEEKLEEENLKENEEIIVATNNLPIETTNRIIKNSETVSRKGSRGDRITSIEDTKQVNYVSYRSLAENNPPEEYTRVVEATATAYCLCQKCCGKSPSHPSYGYTASGIKIVPGTGMKVIAVDPSIIPLGTKVYVDGLNGAWDYGYAIAADTGSAIKNLKIDLYMDTHSEALSWGRKKVNIYVVE